jgi:hypothetical protein
MTFETGFVALDRRLAATVILPIAGTLLRPVAQDCLAMVRAYRDDAATFTARGDLVNALAAVAYAAGWLDATVTLGLAVDDGSDCPLPAGIFPADLADRLDEKTRRYAMMLDRAIAAARPAPDPSSPARRAADAVLGVARCYLALGNSRLEGNREEALALLSYGYGWLDAGVRTGLVAITRARSLFTV